MTRDEVGSEGAEDHNARMAALAPALRKLPPGTHVAFVQEGEEILLYNVTKAFELTAGREPSAVVNVAERAKMIHLRAAGPPPDDKAEIDPEHAQTVDIAYPVLMLESATEVDGSPGRVIDGWHRIYRAAQLGIEELPAIVISAEEEALIRIDSH